MVIVLPEGGACIPRLMAEEPASTAEGQFVRRVTEPLGNTDPFGRSWTLSFVKSAFNELNKWLSERVKRLGAPEKRRLLEYEEGTKVVLDAQVSVQSVALTFQESEPALAAWLVEHVWEMRDNRTGRAVALVFLGPQLEKTLLSGKSDYELVSDAKGASFFFKAITSLPASGRPCVRFSDGNRCRFWSTHIRLMVRPAPDKDMCEQAKALVQLLPALESDATSHTDHYTMLNMHLDFALAVWHWCTCGEALQWRSLGCVRRALLGAQSGLKVLKQHKSRDAILMNMAKTLEFHVDRAIGAIGAS